MRLNLIPALFAGAAASVVVAVSVSVAAPAAPAQATRATSMWVEAEEFAKPGDWVADRTGGAPALRGAITPNAPERTWEQKVAVTMVTAPAAGRYRLWLRTRDFDTFTGKRTFHVAVNGRKNEKAFGGHGTDGWAWEDAGTIDLPAGPVTIELIDSSGYFARCDKLLLTTDAAFKPDGAGEAQNVTHKVDASAIRSAKPAK